jgi:serine/threonine protein kinase
MLSDEDPPTLISGTVIAGKLRIVRPIGAGGMGVVYEVEHEITKHRRALKVLHTRAAQQPGVLERFLREASAAGRIGNAHVAEAFDAGRLDSGEPYLLMELVDGETLDQRLQRMGPLSPGELADLVYQACEGVHAAHAAGIIHRDLKPENLIVSTRDGASFVKILDFGISKFDSARTGTLGITTEGLVMGTPYYMSPEQVRGAALIDARTDVYALGVILYECASGIRPYDARSIEVLAVAIHEGKATPLAELRPTLPPQFCAIVHRAMAVDRNQRFESAWALAEALAPLRVRTSRAPMTTTASPRAVVRPSARPRSATGDAPVSSVVPSTDAALAATMGSGAPGRRSPARLLRLVAAISLAGGVGGAVAVARWKQAPSSPVAAPAVTASVWHPPTVLLEPLPVLAPASDPVAAPSAPTQHAAIALASANPNARPDASAPPPSVTATAGTKTRVDQTGLAGENPFR